MGILSVLCFAISFFLYWAGEGRHPLDPTGLMILGLVFLAAHVVFGMFPWRRS